MRTVSAKQQAVSVLQYTASESLWRMLNNAYCTDPLLAGLRIPLSHGTFCSFGKPIASNQAIQWPLVEYQTEIEMLRLLLRDTANKMDHMSRADIVAKLSDRVSMCTLFSTLICVRCVILSFPLFLSRQLQSEQTGL
jgi:Acyl-CoA dehydrogenase, C-terminal domain